MRILYITTAYSGTMRYFSWQTYADIAYGRLQRSVLSILNKHKNNGHTIHVRFYPNKFATDPSQWVAKQFNFTVLESAVPEILQQEEYDFIITEALATTLLEVLCTKSQVILYYNQDSFNIRSDCLAPLQARVFLIGDNVKYLDAIANILSLEKKPIDDTFLNIFGISHQLIESPTQLTRNGIVEILNGDL